MKAITLVELFMCIFFVIHQFGFCIVFVVVAVMHSREECVG